jgi:hypothetical protein
VFLYVCDQETPKREAKGPSWTISACERMNEYCLISLTESDATGYRPVVIIV